MSGNEDQIRHRAYQIWEEEGRPHGRQDEHWLKAMAELGSSSGAEAGDPHPGMMGDGSEEQNLGQPGNPAARITEAEVSAAFGAGKDDRGTSAPNSTRR